MSKPSSGKIKNTMTPDQQLTLSMGKKVCRLCAQTYSAMLFISLPTGFICHQCLALQKFKKKKREKRLFIVATEPRQKRHGLASLFGTFSIICHRSQTHTHMRALIYSKSVSPHRWNCFQGQGNKKNNVSLTCSFYGKNKVRPGVGQRCVSIDSPLESGEMLSHHGGR